MSTILRALRRLEDDKAREEQAELHDSVLAPARPPPAPRRGWLVIVAAVLAAFVGAGVAWQLAPGGREPSETLARAGGVVGAPDPIPTPVRRERSSPPPVAAAPPEAEAIPPTIVAPIERPTVIAAAEPEPAPVRAAPAPIRVAAAPEFSSEVVVTPRVPQPSLLAEELLEPEPEEALPPRVVRPRSLRPGRKRVARAEDPRQATAPTAAPPAPKPAWRDLEPTPPSAAQQVGRVTAAASEVAPPSAQRIGSLSTGEPAPIPVKIERVGGGPDPVPEPARQVASRTAPEPAPAKPAAARAPSPEPVASTSPSGVPEVIVTETTWHPVPERRRALVTLDGSADPVDLAEGDRVGDLVLTEVKPSGVVFDYRGVELTRRVTASQ